MLARYSTALSGPEYKRKWMIVAKKSDLFIHNMAPNIHSYVQFIHNIYIQSKLQKVS
jgi:hypothetical protein